MLEAGYEAAEQQWPLERLKQVRERGRERERERERERKREKGR